MKYLFPIFAAVVVALFLQTAPISAQTENPGAALLDQATEEKLKASTTDDMAKVIALCIRAKKEGLTGENLNYCNQLLASTQMQRGLFLGSQLIAMAERQQLPANWQAARTNILNELDEAVKVITDQPLPFILIAKLNLLPDGDAKRAEEALDAAEKNAQDDRDQIAQITLLKLSLQKDPAKREELLAKIVETNPDPRLLMLHAANLIDNRKVDEGIDVLKKVLEKDGKNLAALLVLFEQLSNRKRYDDAMKVLDKLGELGELPKEKRDFERAKLLAKMGKLDEAIKLLSELREKNTNDPTILETRTLVYLEKKDYDNALKDVDAALRMNSENVGIKKLKAKVLSAKGDTAGAKEIVDELLKENDDDLGLVLLLADLKENDKAIELLDKITAANPTQKIPLTLLQIQLLSSAKKSRKALELLDPLLEADPDNDEMLRIKGNLLLALNKHSEAIKTFEKVLQTSPEDEMVLNNLSWVLATSPIDMLRNGRKALELAEKACKLSEYKKAYILSTLAAAYAELGDFDKAIEWSNKCLEIAEKDPEDKDRLDELKKELESYKKKQPVREAMDEQ